MGDVEILKYCHGGWHRHRLCTKVLKVQANKYEIVLTQSLVLAQVFEVLDGLKESVAEVMKIHPSVN
jgi:hypothetical protein